MDWFRVVFGIVLCFHATRGFAYLWVQGRPKLAKTPVRLEWNNAPDEKDVGRSDAS